MAKKITVKKRVGDVLEAAVERMKAKRNEGRVSDHEEQQRTKAAMPIHTALQRLTQGANHGITPGQVMSTLRINKQTHPRAWTLANKAVNELHDKGHEGRDLVSGYALEIHDAIQTDKAENDVEYGPTPNRYDLYRQVTGHKHPHDWR